MKVLFNWVYNFETRGKLCSNSQHLRDMNPSTENTTNPAKIDVAQLTIGTRIASLQLWDNKYGEISIGK